MEKRKHPRVDGDFKVSGKSFDKYKISLEDSKAKNISEGGMLLKMPRDGMVGSKIVIKFTLPDDDEKILVRGKIAWIENINPQDYNIGIEFINIRESDINKIKKYVSKES